MTEIEQQIQALRDCVDTLKREQAFGMTGLTHTIYVFENKLRALESGQLPKRLDSAKALEMAQGCTYAWVGLIEDWDATADLFWSAGKPHAGCKAHTSSVWATPAISIEGADPVPCFVEYDPSK